MGATTFTHFQPGQNAGAAFAEAVGQALYNHGHDGYTGTIAEKPGFQLRNEGRPMTPAEAKHSPARMRARTKSGVRRSPSLSGRTTAPRLSVTSFTGWLASKSILIPRSKGPPWEVLFRLCPSPSLST